MKTFFIESSQLEYMNNYEPYATKKYEKRKVKFDLLDKVVSSLSDKWDRLKDGTKQVYDMICFLAAERGFFYAGDKYLAEHHEVSERTVQYRLKELVELGQVIKLNKRAKNCNGRGKPIYLFVNHPYFSVWCNFLNIDCVTDCDTENAEIPCESKDEENKKVSTFLLPKKQERNNNISILDKIRSFVELKIVDAVNRGTNITYMSSYVDKVFREIKKKALVEENLRQIKARKQKEEENRRLFREIHQAPKVEFYNWLES